MEIKEEGEPTVALTGVPLSTLLALHKLLGPTTPQDERDVVSRDGQSWSKEEEEATFLFWDELDDFLDGGGYLG